MDVQMDEMKWMNEQMERRMDPEKINGRKNGLIAELVDELFN